MDLRPADRAVVDDARAVRVDSNVAAVLQRQTQELLDAVTFGRAEVWERYLDPRVSITTEDGRVRTQREPGRPGSSARYCTTIVPVICEPCTAH